MKLQGSHYPHFTDEKSQCSESSSDFLFLKLKSSFTMKNEITGFKIQKQYMKFTHIHKLRNFEFFYSSGQWKLKREEGIFPPCSEGLLKMDKLAGKKAYKFI
jgi:hypothetical protein